MIIHGETGSACVSYSAMEYLHGCSLVHNLEVVGTPSRSVRKVQDVRSQDLTVKANASSDGCQLFETVALRPPKVSPGLKRMPYAPPRSHLGLRVLYERFKFSNFKSCLFFAFRVRPGEDIFSHSRCALRTKKAVASGAQDEAARYNVIFLVRRRVHLRCYVFVTHDGCG